jgi:predicted transcriptional regulator
MNGEQQTSFGLGSSGMILLEEQSKRFELKRRSRLETYYDIIKAVGAGAEKPTHIMYKANLSWAALDCCLETLEYRGFISKEFENETRRRYHLTQKGYTFLNQYLTIRDDLTPERE